MGLGKGQDALDREDQWRHGHGVKKLPGCSSHSSDNGIGQ